MKKLLFGLMVVLAFAGMAEAVESTGAIDSTSRSLTVRLIGIATPDTLDSWTLDYWALGDNSTRSANTATIPAAYAQGDTTIITGLYNGTEYHWRFNYVTRTGAAGATKTAKTLTGIATTDSINQVITYTTDSLAVDTLRYNLRIQDTWTSADSTLLKIALQYKKSNSSTWLNAPVRAVWASNCAIGRDSVYLASPDTLMAFSPLRIATTGGAQNLEPGVVYNFRVLGYHLANTQNVCDTSNTLTYTTPMLLGYKPSYYDLNAQTGYLGDDVWHYSWSFTSTGLNFKTPKIPISGYSFLRAQYKLLGWDNNQTADSISLYLNTDRSGIMIRVDSLFHRDIDTTAWTDFWLRTAHEGAIGDTVEMKSRDYGGYLQYEADCTDSAGWSDSTIDTRVLDLWIIGSKK